ncbi:retrovirus-related pol polyprotein from transposon TNT 1-94 [Tanacetum coccineum]
MTVICYNCKGEGHMSKQCTKPKRKQDDSWFKDKVMLVQAQVNGQILHEEEIAFLADPGIVEGQATQIVITIMPLIKPMIWMHMALIVMNSILSKLLSWQTCLIMVQMFSLSVNETLVAELERYKEQVKVLKEGQNVDLKCRDNISDSCFQNPFYLKKAQQLEPKLYDGNVIKNTSAIVIPDSEKTLMLVE